jgi:hypothetical protein
MTEEECWRVVELARVAAGGDVNKQSEAIERHLATRKAEEIVAFSTWTRTKMLEANTPDLLVAVEWIFVANDLAEVSGESWEYFRGWLVARGRREFDAALKNPDVLADYFTTFEDLLGGEEFEYAAHRAYESRSGAREVPDEMYEPSLVETWPGDHPKVERERAWLIARFPKLTKKFGPPSFL